MYNLDLEGPSIDPIIISTIIKGVFLTVRECWNIYRPGLEARVLLETRSIGEKTVWDKAPPNSLVAIDNRTDGR